MTSTHASTASLVRLASVVALIGLALALVAAPAAAQGTDYPPVPEITITTPGATIIIEGRSWRPGTQVTIIFNNPSGQTFNATAVADENGAIETDVPIPDDTEPGTLAVAFTGTGADGTPREEQGTVQVVSSDANVADAAASTGSADSSGTSASEQVASARPANVTATTSLPATGAQPTPAILLAVALMGAGVVSLFGARRARARRSTQ